jgi:hypothetical protein
MSWIIRMYKYLIRLYLFRSELGSKRSYQLHNRFSGHSPPPLCLSFAFPFDDVGVILIQPWRYYFPAVC